MENQIYVASQSLVEPSKFFTEFSLKDLVENNTSPSGSLFASHSGGGGGSVASGGNSERTTHNKSAHLFYQVKSEDVDKFDEKQFISSLRKDVEDRINQSGLIITKTDSPSSSNFHLEYEFEKMKGQIDISGATKNGYYELQAMILEKHDKNK